MGCLFSIDSVVLSVLVVMQVQVDCFLLILLYFLSEFEDQWKQSCTGGSFQLFLITVGNQFQNFVKVR